MIAVVGGGLIFYFSNQSKNNDNSSLETANSPEKSIGLYVGDDFTIVSPKGWVQTHMQSTLVSFQNLAETHPEGSAAAKINFKSYIAVSSDSTQGKAIEEITKLIKQQVQAVAPSVSFSSETDEIIDGQPAQIMEADLNQQNIDFKILMAVIIKGDEYFTISANTTTQKWTEYNEIFYDTIRSFKFKK